LLDFGLLGRLDDDTRRNLALLLLAVAQTARTTSPTLSSVSR
jgi:predicted unusual protein kinase regulating ubiquinone biosynthesis (AarF/ABC1/UbiB family)